MKQHIFDELQQLLSKCHKPRETRGPIETIKIRRQPPQGEKSHKPRETRGPIETPALGCGLGGLPWVTSRAKRAALLKQLTHCRFRICFPVVTSRAKRAALLKPEARRSCLPTCSSHKPREMRGPIETRLGTGGLDQGGRVTSRAKCAALLKRFVRALVDRIRLVTSRAKCAALLKQVFGERIRADLCLMSQAARNARPY